MDLDRESLRKAGLAFAAVTEVTIYTVSGYFAGKFIDVKLDTGLWFSVLLTLLGFVGGFYRLYRVMKLMDKAETKDPK